MSRGKTKYLPLIALTVDIIILTISFFIALQIRFEGVLPDVKFYTILFIGWVSLWVAIVLSYNLYEIPAIIKLERIVSKNLSAIAAFIIFSSSFIYFATEYKFSRIFFFIAVIIFAILIILWRITLIKVFKIYRRNGFNYRRVVMVGVNINVEKILEKVLMNPNYGFQLAALFTDSVPDTSIKKYYKGNLDLVVEYCKNNAIDDIFISLPYYKSELINELLKFGDNNLIRVHIIPEFSEYLSQIFAINYIENVPILNFRSEPLQSLSNRIIKRGFDVFFSLLVIILVFSWLFPILAIIIKLSSKGPVFFVQERTGKDGESFSCLKFRSMVVNGICDEKQATKNDPRITKIGAFMRKTSIDELPQVFNVLVNQMSIVGPRPHMVKHTELYRGVIDKFMVRHFAKPGLTGWAQINGFRGETKNVQDMVNRADADIWYIENWSFVLDLKIIALTAWTILFKKEENAF